MHLKWKTNSLDLDTLGGEYLAFDSSNYTFWATCVNATSEKVQVTQKVFTNLMEDAKSSCSSFFPAIILVSLCFCIVYLFFFWGLILLFFWSFICL